MQHDNSDDVWGFWNDEPTRQLRRTPANIRSHGETRMVPVVRADRTRPITLPHMRRNPLMARVCLMVGAMLLLVPIALGLRDDNRHSVRSDTRVLDPIPIGELPRPAPTDSTLAATTDAPTTLAVTTTVPVTPAPTDAAPVTPAPTEPPTEPPTTVAKATKKTTKPKPSATVPPAPQPAAATQSAATTACDLTYTIVAGDAWSTIAARATISMKALLAANNATIKTVLLPGKNVCLPPGAVAPTVTKAPTATSAQPATTQPKPAPTSPATTQPATPPVTLAPPPTQPPAPANTYTKAEAAQIIRDVWPDDLEDEAIRIATRESNLIPTARNSCCYGLFQINYVAHATWLTNQGVTSAAQLYDPRVNAKVAWALYTTSGWAPWATPTTVSV